ncbi:threonine/serine exporter family protein [Jeotgalibaca sp. MA1X17-3]|uniref:threonine/serine ThrE exporter family protein n=1 Tax=Jeotgalibaca sp. MA1X17-3 TaxID=2908211 RepID=UPI001F2AE1C8|nr:threonine/serine exporter family protein [Jeotgalibaca sp. MA1X17-3]UJF16514.1 threonine/serine exporter family protein [Jeotgalibaca sp. MA1X17-3]
MPEMDYELYMDTAVLAGKIMLESNAETYRVEDTVTRILQITNLEMIDALALTTGLIATLDSPHMHAITVVKRISNRTVNLNKITKVNDVSRRLTEGVITVHQAYDLLQNIDEIQYNEFQRDIAIIGFIQAIVLMFDGGKNEFISILPISIAVSIMIHFGRSWRVKPFILDMVASFVIALLATIISRYTPYPIQDDILIISAIMPLVPGTALTIGVRDIFRGDYMSGGAKILEALMIAIFIAIGIGTGLILGGQLLS